MRTLIALLVFAVCTQAGIIKGVTYPVVHPKKTSRFLGRAVKHTAKGVKTVAF